MSDESRNVTTARAAQRVRYAEAGVASNAEADVGVLAMDHEARSLAEQAAERLRLSARGFTRLLRIARSIADLAGVEVIRRADVAEALAFRHRVPGRVG